MRILLAIAAAAILMTALQTPGDALAKGRRQAAGTKTEDTAKKKVNEDAYKRAVKSLPASTEKPDPWKNIH